MHSNDAKKSSTTIREVLQSSTNGNKIYCCFDEIAAYFFFSLGSFSVSLVFSSYPSVVFHFVIVQLLICIVDYKVALYNIQNICCSRLRSLECVFFLIRILLYLCVHFKFRFVKVFFLVVGESHKLNNTAQQFLNFYFVVARSLAEPSTYITTLRSKVPIELNLQHESTTFQEFLFSYILHSYIFCKNIHTTER